MNRSEPGWADVPSIEGYHDLRPVATGGFSQVYLGVEDGFRRPVAIKVLTSGISDERERQIFERECQAMGSISFHPHIVTVYSASFTNEGLPALVMEFYSGGAISDRLKGGAGPMPFTEVLDIGVKISGALQTAHDIGLLHRDIKPNNIFVSQLGQPALGDFGISSFDDERTITGGGGLTVSYAPPEVLEGQPSTARSDIYSLAATLYSMAAGRRPFSDTNRKLTAAELAIKILREDAPPLAGAAAGLQPVLAQAMAKNQAARFSSAAAMGAALQELQRRLGCPVSDLVLERSSEGDVEDETTVARIDLPEPSPERFFTFSPHPNNGPVTPAHARTGAAGEAPAVPPAPSVELTPSSDPTPSTDLDDREETLTVTRARAPRTPVDTPEPEGSTETRRWLAIALPVGLVAVLALAAVVFIGPTEEPTLDAASDLSTTLPDDDFLISMATPEAVVAAYRADGETVEVSWSEISEAEKYNVEQISGFDPGTQQTVETELAWPVLGSGTACFTVQAVGPGGRLSAPSAVACTAG
ncbi:MAG: protein kinase [Actinomycetia bacterium]|nr:protein kinase [Actinomycetes bacterium]